MFSSDLQFIFVFASGVVAFLFQFGALMWRIAGVEKKIHDRIYDVQLETTKAIQHLQKEASTMELRVTTNYLKKDSFYNAMNNIDSRLIRLEGKLDLAISRVPSGSPRKP